MLLLLNGAPAVGKSTLAKRFADDHALSLVVEFDEIRRHLGQWERRDESRAVARELAAGLALKHMRGGYDVVMPQFLAQPEFGERARSIAAEHGARFAEVILVDDDDTIIERFTRRRAKWAAAGFRHPEADLDDYADFIRYANTLLRDRAHADGLPIIDMGAGVDAAYARLCAALA